jgi:hypothetical protein
MNPNGTAMPVMKINTGPSNADSMPPAPKLDQKIGSLARFIARLEIGPR